MKKLSTIKGASISVLAAVVMFIVVILASSAFLPADIYESTDYYILIIFLEGIPLGLGVGLYLVLTKQKLKDIIVFSRPQAQANKKYMSILILLAAVMAIVGRGFVGALQIGWITLLEKIGLTTSIAQLPPIDNIVGLVYGIIGVAVMPAILEELIFRGILQKGLLRNTKPKIAILISSIFFMLMHLSVESISYTFVLGCLLGYMAYASGTIVPSIVFHFVNNAFSVLALYILTLGDFFNLQDEVAYDFTQMEWAESLGIGIGVMISFTLLALACYGYIKVAKAPPENPYLKSMNKACKTLLIIAGSLMLFVMVLITVLNNINI